MAHRAADTPPRATRRAPALLAAALAATAGLASADDARMVEDFESIAKVRVTGGKLTAVGSGQAVTHGKQAATLPAGAAVHLTLKDVDLAATPWLKVDTQSAQSWVTPVELTFRIGNRDMRLVGYVRPGADTLCAPLPVAAARSVTGWPTGDAPLVIANASKSAMTLDNVRLAPTAPPPPDSVLLDFGGPRQAVWPGFKAAGADSTALRWSGDLYIGPQAMDLPDPLLGDSVGPITAGSTADYAMLTAPTKAPSAVAWLWLTHYAYGLQAPEYAVKFRGRVVKRRRLARRQVFGPECLLSGKDGAWTPEWLNTVYTGQLVDLLPLTLSGRANRIDLSNCQVAALAMAPTARRAELAAYVKQVEADLAQYRRQFVLAHRRQVLCEVSATEAEAANGLMAFRPPAEWAFVAGWAPREADRVKDPVPCLTANGSLAVWAVAVVPTKKLASLSVALEPLTADGRPLRLSPRGAEAWLLGRVPYVRDAAVAEQPWLLNDKLPAAEANEIVHLAVRIGVAQTAAPGTYRGTLRVTHSAGKTLIPLTLEVADVGEPPQGVVTFCPIDATRLSDFYHGLADTLNAGQQAAALLKTQQQLLTVGFNSLVLQGPAVSSEIIRPTTFVDELKATPTSLIHGHVLIDISREVKSLPARKPPRGSSGRASLSDLVSQVDSLASRRGIRSPLHFLGTVLSPTLLTMSAKTARTVALARGRPVVRVPSSVFVKLSDGAVARDCEPFHTIILHDSGYLNDAIAKYRALKGEREAYVSIVNPDRCYCGFRAAAAGASGVCLDRVAARIGPYSGGDPTKRGLLALEADSTYTRTLACLQMQRGFDDFLLYRRAEQLLKKAKALGIDAAPLRRVTEDIRTRTEGRNLGLYDPELLRSSAASPKELDSWRESLIRAAAAVAKQLPRK